MFNTNNLQSKYCLSDHAAYMKWHSIEKLNWVDEFTFYYYTRGRLTSSPTEKLGNCRNDLWWVTTTIYSSDVHRAGACASASFMHEARIQNHCSNAWGGSRMYSVSVCVKWLPYSINLPNPRCCYYVEDHHKMRMGKYIEPWYDWHFHSRAPGWRW